MHSSWCSTWPEAFSGVSDSGYMTEDLFDEWARLWLDKTDPGNGEARVLFLDNHHSHLGLKTLRLLREHNVRVVSLHPHTTHVLCVLDVAVFKTFKGELKRLFEAREGPITIDNVAGLIRAAYVKATQLTTDAVTGAVTSAAISGFAKVGLIPFTKKVLIDGVFGAATEYANRMKKEGEGGQPVMPKPLALTADEREKLVADITAQNLQVKLAREAAPAPSQRARVTSQLLTSSEWLAQETAAKEAKAAEAAAKAERAAARKANAEANKAVAAASAAKRAEKASKKAAEAAARVAAAAEVPAAVAVAGKRRREGQSAVEGARHPVKRVRKQLAVPAAEAD